eukprot:TRINITY_DN380_c0_g1_i3.p1 TRINITY_DN380_c0_g1~~TRINITY_DN380_c0_g1_i3.p1  ORF type:complete len:535 (+),score=170.86 TRINITY_DN380_c0_g1_i3:87-1691(+)
MAQPQYNPYGQPPAYNPGYVPPQAQPNPFAQHQGYAQPQPNPYAQPQGYAPPPYGQPQPQPAYAQPAYVQPMPAHGHQQVPPSAYAQPPHLNAPLLDKQDNKFTNSEYRDLLWAIIFVLHFLVILVLAIALGSKWSDKIVHEQSDLGGAGFWKLLFACLGAGALVSAFWLYMIRRFANCLVWFTCLLSAGLSLALALLCFSSHATGMGVVMVILFLFNLLYLYLIRDRIQFAAAMLEMVVQVIQQYPATVYTAFGFVFVQAAWVLLWAVATGFSLVALNKTSVSDRTRNLAYFGFLVSLYWGAQVCKNVLHVTVSGTFASWYFLYPQAMPSNPTLGALKRATTTSFGSICLGSLIIAIIKAIRAIVHQARRQNNGLLQACAECFIRCIENIVQYFNVYAFTYVAVYGRTYCESAKDTFEMFKTKGIDAVINDDLTGGVMALGAVVGGCVVGAVSLWLSHYVYDMSNWALWVFSGFLIGLVMTMCAMEVIESCVASFFVCFAEDPAALNATKPEAYQHIATAWRARYGDLYLGAH